MKTTQFFFSGITSILLLFVFSCAVPKAEWVTTTETESWVKNQPVSFNGSDDNADVTIDTTLTAQKIEGFGGCFNELGWVSLNRLRPEDRAIIMTELFQPGAGANFTVCRMPVGANDFSRDWYSYNETEGDFDNLTFSIANDKETLIPFIKEALQLNPALKIWASPWSPPSWMKWNKHYACSVPWEGLAPQYHNNLSPDKQGKEGTNMFIQEEAYFKSYAQYFGKFADSYKNEGIQISMVMPQNEFNSCQIFPSCTWTASGLATFIGKYLGPEMQSRGVELFFGTMERPNEALVDTILNDPLAGKFVKGAGFQWAGKDAIGGIHKRYPNLTLYQTEQECGDGKNDWKHCNHAWELMKHYFSNGANTYLYWNISLDKGGFSRWGWQQNSLVTVDSETATFRFNHEYYLLKHFSHFVKPSAKRLITNGSFDNLLAFLNPDKSVVCVLQNSESTEKTIKIAINGKIATLVLVPGSFHTIVLN